MSRPCLRWPPTPHPAAPGAAIDTIHYDYGSRTREGKSNGEKLRAAEPRPLPSLSPRWARSRGLDYMIT
eukprot:scaffold31044_cov112-Isochrysis_galbana.AAC.3